MNRGKMVDALEQAEDLSKVDVNRLDGRLCRGKVVLENRMLVCTCDGSGEKYDFFTHYQPQYYQVLKKLPSVKKMINDKIVRMPHIEFLTRDSLDFCSDFGLLKKEERQGGPKCVLSLGTYEYERSLFSLFHKLLDAIKDKNDAGTREALLGQREIVDAFYAELDANPGHSDAPNSATWVRRPLYDGFCDFDTASMFISGVFELKTATLRPILSLLDPIKATWEPGALLAGLYLVYWIEEQQGMYSAMCDKCGQPFIVGKRTRFCSQKCRTQFHTAKSKRKKNLS